jgi:two-component system cell cycle sensor histidine kinase PleC
MIAEVLRGGRVSVVMGEVTAEMIERGRKGDPAEAGRRRKMSLKLKHARHALTTNPGDENGPYDSMVRLFAQSAKSATPAVVALTIAIGAAAGFWAPLQQAVTWSAIALAAIAARFGLASLFLAARDPEKAARRWRYFFVFGEAVFGATWAMIVSIMLSSPNPDAVNFTLIVVMLVAGMIAMVGSAIPAAVGAGLAPIMMAIVAHLGASTTQQTVIFGLLCSGVLGYFVVLASRLHRAALAGLSYQEEKDALIAELEQAKLNSDEARRVALPGDDEPRAAHAAQRHPRILRSDGRRAVWRPQRSHVQGICQGHPFERPAPAHADQRNPRPFARRGRPL